jgi:hypothetical protein
MWKNILPHIHGWMIFMDENVNDKWQQMIFFMNVGNKFFFAKIEQKKQDGKTCVDLFWKFHHMKCSNHISLTISYPLIPSIFQLCSIQTI